MKHNLIPLLLIGMVLVGGCNEVKKTKHVERIDTIWIPTAVGIICCYADTIYTDD